MDNPLTLFNNQTVVRTPKEVKRPQTALMMVTEELRKPESSPIQQERQVKKCFSYLVTAGVEFYGQEEGIEDHVTRLDVDRGLSLAHRAQVPGGVHQAPEGRHCNTKETPEVVCMGTMGDVHPQLLIVTTHI